VTDPGDLGSLGADAFVVAVGDNTVRAGLVARVRAEHPDLALVSAVHPAAVVARDAVLGPGVTLMAGAVVANGCTIGEGALLGTNASIDHDGVLGAWASLAPGVATGGNVTIGAYSAIGVGAALIHGVTVGPHSVVGAGAVVLRDVPDHVVAHGVPAVVARARAEGEPYLVRRRP
jgi:sugar O-acyltransferase (sialic acid O-acetyltransferase NeuD family)